MLRGSRWPRLVTSAAGRQSRQRSEIRLPNSAAKARICSASAAYCSGSNAWGPSDMANSGQLWTSMWTPSAPAATPAKAQAGIKSGRPVAWLGSTMIGRWLIAFDGRHRGHVEQIARRSCRSS